MKKWFVCFLFFAFALTGNSKTIAISYFDNSSGDAKYNALSKGIADMLITDLSKVKGVNIVEREKLEKLIQEIKLGQSKYFDPATAQKLGKGLGAQNILTGSFYLLDNIIRIDARLIDVQTGAIISAEQVTGSKNSFFSLHQQLAALLSKNLNVPYSPNLSGLYKANEEVEFTAVVNYSNAVELQDQGMTADAQELLEKTIMTFPKFRFAKNKLDELREWLKQAENSRELLIAEEIRNSISALDPQSDKFGMEISKVWSTMLISYKFKQILSFNNTLRNMKLDLKKKLYGEGSNVSLGEMMSFYDCLAFNSLKKPEEIIESAKSFITEYPVSMYFHSIKGYLEGAIKELEKRENGKNGLENKLAAAALDANLNYLNNLRFNSNLQFVNETDYKYYLQLYKSVVLSVSKENMDGWEKTAKFSEFTTFFDAAMHFSDIQTMEEIITVCKKIFTDSDYSMRISSIEKRLAEFNPKIAEIKAKIGELERIAEKGSKDELEKVLSQPYNFDKYNRPDLLLSIYSQYIDNFKAGNEKETEFVLDAWKGLIINTGKIKSIEEAKKKYAVLQEKAPDFINSAEVYEKELKEIDRDLTNLDKDYNKFLNTIKNNEPMAGVLENYAKIYKDNYQYAEEAVTRKQLIDQFQLDESNGAVQIYLLAMSYYNLGYFENVSKTASQLKEKYPLSNFNDAINSIADVMPR